MATQPTDQTFEDIYNTYQAGRVGDAESLSRNSGYQAALPIILDYKSIFGRMPTIDEVANANPVYAQNRENGGAFTAQLFQQQQNSPQNLYQKQQSQYLSDAPKYADQVSNMFQSNLGRAPTNDELSHFGALMASGQDAYQLQQALQQTTEYQTKQTQDFTKQLGGQLQSTNADYFSKYILPSIQSQNAMAGRTQDSSGYQAQLANAAQQQNYDLQNYLAQVSAGQYGQSTANAANQYNALMGQQYGLQNANVSNTLANQAANTQYNQNMQMYQLQQAAYNNYLNNYGKRNGLASGLSGALQGGMQGALLGGKFGGPWGALAGGVGGAAAGGASGAYL